MLLQSLPAEILIQVFRHCSSISTAINLSLTCHRLYALLRDSQKLPVLFDIAETIWGPLEDAFQLLTHNSSQSAHLKRTPVLSFALLVQVSRVGRVAVWYEQIYPLAKWNGEKAKFRRNLDKEEAYVLRRAVYRSWLYDKAFHNSECHRFVRSNPAMINERCQLLRNWSSSQLIELEDIRCIFESILASEICPTDGDVYWRATNDPFGNHDRTMYAMSSNKLSLAASKSLFHTSREDECQQAMPPSQLREQLMSGWGDEIEQYHNLNDLLKLTPADMMHIYNHVITKEDVEGFVEEKLGSQWFWNNGETMLHTWMIVLHSRGLDVRQIREAIVDGSMGIVSDK